MTLRQTIELQVILCIPIMACMVVLCNVVFYIGILAGMWPCGVISFIRELFIAESKAQVYGHLHQFLQSNPDTAKKLRNLNDIYH